MTTKPTTAQPEHDRIRVILDFKYVPNNNGSSKSVLCYYQMLMCGNVVSSGQLEDAGLLIATSLVNLLMSGMITDHEREKLAGLTALKNRRDRPALKLIE